MAVSVAEFVGAGVFVGVGVTVTVGVFVAVFVDAGFTVGVFVCVGVRVAVLVGVFVGVGVRVAVAVAVGDGVDVDSARGYWVSMPARRSARLTTPSMIGSARYDVTPRSRTKTRSWSLSASTVRDGRWTPWSSH